MNATDVIILGAGLAGLYTALNLPSHRRVVVLTAYEDNSSLAQGGVAASLHSNEDAHAHASDTMKAGHYVNSLSAVRQLVDLGPQQIRKLMALGVAFDTDEQGAIATTLEGGHSSHRILHVDGDRTGQGIMEALRARVKEAPNITLISGSHLLHLLKSRNQVTGVLHLNANRIHQLNAPCVVIATGGLGALYATTTNHRGAVGTGIALAHAADVGCRNLQYIQFHPTAFYDPNGGHQFLITEALRGEGAHLLNACEERFMERYDQRLELAPRDIISKAIHKEMQRDQGPHVWLDTRHLHRQHLENRFPGITHYLAEKHLHFGEDLIPVAPVAHYTIGGITVDGQGRTNLKGLYACGEAASTGAHGANRLASNSLLECLVYGDAIARDIPNVIGSLSATMEFCENHLYRDFKIDSDPEEWLKEHRLSMSRHVGILRKSEDLKQLETSYKNELMDLEKGRYKTWSDFKKWSVLYTSLLIIKAALGNPSLGCHSIDESLEVIA